jgi:hypothetical protein
MTVSAALMVVVVGAGRTTDGMTVAERNQEEAQLDECIEVGKGERCCADHKSAIGLSELSDERKKKRRGNTLREWSNVEGVKEVEGGVGRRERGIPSFF